MLQYIWTLVRRRNENYQFKDFLKMHYVCLAVILIVSTCRADMDLRSKRAMIMKEAEENIQQLRLAKEKAEREEREKNSLAILADELIKDSFESQLQSKMDILYDNHTDLTKELKFVPAIFNCGKEFDIFKLLDLAKAHRNVTTEAPKCLEDLEEPLGCPGSNTRPRAESNPNNTGTGTQRSRVIQGRVTSGVTRNIPEVPAGVAVNPGVATATPQAQIADKKGDAKPAEKAQQKTVKEKPAEAKRPQVVGVLDETSDIAADPVGLEASQSGISNPEANGQGGIIARPAAALGSTLLANVPLLDKAAVGTVQAQEVPSQNVATQALEQASGKQLPKGADHETSITQVQEQKQQVEKPETSAAKDSLQSQQAKLAVAPVAQTASQQKQEYQQVFTPALVTDLQPQAPAAAVELVTDAPQQLLQTVKQAVVAHEQENQAIKPTVNVGPEQKIQANVKPAMNIILTPQEKQVIKIAQQISQQGTPQNVKQTAQSQERQNEVLKLLTQVSEQKSQVLKPLTQGAGQQGQALKSLSQATEQKQVSNPLTQGAEQQNQPVKAPVFLSEQTVVVKTVSDQPQLPQPVNEQQPSVREQQLLKPSSVPEHQPFALKPVATAQQPAKPPAPVVQTAVQQSGDIVQQPVAKQMVNCSLSSQQSQVPVEEADKAPVAAPVDVIIMDPCSNANDSSGNRVELAPEIVPATAGFDGLANPTVLHNSVTAQNVIVLDKNMENKNIPANLRNDPKLDYFYYQD